MREEPEVLFVGNLMYVPYAEYKQKVSDLEEETVIRERLSQLLDETANALHCGRKENGLWSFHDLPELSANAMNRIAELENCIR